MRRLLPILLLASMVGTAMAESHNPADYPLRVHIFRRSETTFYHNRQTEEAKGEGRANLFEGGEPKGIDFQFECETRLQTSSGYETFPAKWKKPGQELVILQPQFGKSGYDSLPPQGHGQGLRLRLPLWQPDHGTRLRLQTVDDQARLRP